MLEQIPGLVVGAVLSWFISRYYFRRQDKERPTWLTAKTVKEVLVQHPEDLDWTVDQILKLYKNKIHGIDEHFSVPFGVCPECGGNDVKHSTTIDDEHDDMYEDHTCRKCGWSDGGSDIGS